MIGLRGQFSELVLLPAMACLMPWGLTYRLNRQLSRFQALYGDVTDQAAQAATATGLFEGGEVWKRHYRLNRLVDGIDPWVSRWRSDRWMDRHLEVKGQWPTDEPFVAAGFHWGTGLWALRHIKRHVGPISMVLRPEEEWSSSFSGLMRRYHRAGEKLIEHAGGAPIIHTGSGLSRRVAEGFEKGNNLLVLLDVPKGNNRDQLSQQFLGQTTYFASGLINMARQLGRPIVPYAIGLDFSTGKRQLQILPPVDANSTAEVMDMLAGWFDELVRDESPPWHFWHLHKSFMSPDFQAVKRPEQDSVEKETVLYSLHMEKCGGTSVDRVYREVYGDHYYLYDPGPPEAHREPEFPDGVRAVHGHMFYGLHEKLRKRPHAYTTMLRDPLERFMSNFEHLRRYEHPLHEHVMKDDGLRFFCSDHGARHYRNLFVRRLAGAWEEVDDSHLDEAERVLRSFAVVGTLENPEAWVKACSKRFAWPEVSFGHFNAAPSSGGRFQQLSVQDQDMVRKANELDLALMARVQDILA